MLACIIMCRGEKAGNQCCYDKNGYLITDPPGAGTVDKVSPERDIIGHFFCDVLPALFCCQDEENCEKYLEKRPIDDRALPNGFRILRFLGKGIYRYCFS